MIETKAPKRLLRIGDVMQRTGLSKTTIYERERIGTFPRHVPIGGRLSAWVESEVDKWLDDRISERDGLASAA